VWYGDPTLSLFLYELYVLIRRHLENVPPVYDHLLKIQSAHAEARPEIPELIDMGMACVLLSDRIVTPSSRLRQEFCRMQYQTRRTVATTTLALLTSLLWRRKWRKRYVGKLEGKRPLGRPRYK
jgi:hypothetical protein